MNKLPFSDGPDIGALSRIFDKTSASYKFLLFKSILESVQRGNTRLVFKDLALSSMANAWYSIHFYKLSYGHADRMTHWVAGLDREMTDRVLVSDLSYHKIYELLTELPLNEYRSLNLFLNEFAKLVPYRLITPWFEKDLRGLADSKKNAKITELSLDDERSSIYKISHGPEGLTLVVRDEWAQYLKHNYTIINGWWSYHFLHYLQKRNPTVLSLATKLAPPLDRNMALVKKLFQGFFSERVDMRKCLYTGADLPETYSHDHFFPWSFLGSDPLYNFVPTTKNINSSKSNQIPAKKLLNEISEFQYVFFDYLRSHDKKNALEFYYNDLQIKESSKFNSFEQAVKRFYEPLYHTASNQGFSMNWKV